MHRRPTLTQRHGLFRSTRFILYGRRVRVIRLSPLVRDDQYIPLAAVDPDARVERAPDLRLASLGALCACLGLAGLLEWLPGLPAGARAGCVGLVALGTLLAVLRGMRGRTLVHHGALSLVADLPDAAAFRHFEARLVEASRHELALQGSDEGGPGPLSVAAEIRRLHQHHVDGLLGAEDFERHKQRLIRGLGEALG